MNIAGYAVINEKTLKRHARYGKIYAKAGVANTYADYAKGDYRVYPLWIDEPIQR